MMTKPVIVSGALTVVAGMTCLLTLQAGYVTADDPNQMLIASGHMAGGTPDPHLVFSNYLWGLGLVVANRLTQAVNWYTWTLVMTHLLAAWAVTWSAWRLAASSRALLPLLLVWWGFEARFLVNLQFTHAAEAATVGGVALLLVGASLGERGPTTLGTILAWVGSLIRLEAFLLAAMIAAPLALWCAWRRGRILRRALVALAGMVLIGVLVNAAAYRLDPEWSRFPRVVKTMRALINGPLVIQPGGDPEAAEAALEAVGWNELEWSLFEDYRFIEAPANYTLSALTELADRLGAMRSPAQMARLLWLQKADFAFLPLVLLVAMVPLLHPERSGGYALLAGSTAAVAGVQVLVLLRAWRLPRHARMPLTYALAVGAVLGAVAVIDQLPPGRRRRLANAAVLVAVVGGVCLGSFLLVRDARANVRDVRNHYLIERTLLAGRSRPVYFNNLEFLRTFDPWRPPGGLEHALLPVAGTLRTPLVADALEPFGHERLPEAIRAGDVLVVATEDFLELLREHLSVVAGGRVKYRILATYGPVPRGSERNRQFSVASFGSEDAR